jgi:hypothetical protein
VAAKPAKLGFAKKPAASKKKIGVEEGALSARHQYVQQ